MTTGTAAGAGRRRQVIADVLGEFDPTLGPVGHTTADQLSQEPSPRV